MTSQRGHSPLLAYCAASVAPAVEPAAAAFERGSGILVKLEIGPSGRLLEKLKRDKRGDLFIPAAAQPYLEKCRADGAVSDIFSLASLRLVLAHGKAVGSATISLDDLVQGRRRYAIAHEEAAAGLATLEALAPVIDWKQFAEGAAEIYPSVTEVAKAVREAVVDCGIVWDATARQYGLAIVDAAELASAQVDIAAGLLTVSHNPDGARKFAQYLAAADQGGAFFKMLGYSVRGS